MSEALGTASKLWRYPVKSMLGEECEHLDLDARGVRGDRLFAVRDPTGRLGSGKTTRRFRQIDGLFGLRAAYGSELPEIIFPDGRRLRADDPQIHASLSDLLAFPVTLAREDGTSQLDAGPVHLLTTASLAWLRALLPDAAIDERRFRPNLLIDIPGAAQVEQAWIGKTLRIGDEVTLRVTNPTERCRMVTLAQAGGLASDPRVLQSISRNADLRFGVYAEVLAPGTIKRNDAVTAR